MYRRLEIAHRPKQIQHQRIINHQMEVEIGYLHEPTADFTSHPVVCGFLTCLRFDFIRADDMQSQRIIFCSLNREQQTYREMRDEKRMRARGSESVKKLNRIESNESRFASHRIDTM